MDNLNGNSWKQITPISPDIVVLIILVFWRIVYKFIKLYSAPISAHTPLPIKDDILNDMAKVLSFCPWLWYITFIRFSCIHGTSRTHHFHPLGKYARSGEWCYNGCKQICYTQKIYHTTFGTVRSFAASNIYSIFVYRHSISENTDWWSRDSMSARFLHYFERLTLISNDQDYSRS